MPSTLSVLVPIYNERATIERLLNEVVAVNTGLTLEVLACDDGSTDGTRDILSRLSLPGLKVIFMHENVGRGGVIKHLWTLATGDIYVHQDADLEYDPQDYMPLLQPILAGQADVVYGSRFKGSIEGMRFAQPHGQPDHDARLRACCTASQVSDLMTCYKMYRSSLIRGTADPGQRLRLRGRVHGAAGAARRALRRGAGRLPRAHVRRGQEDPRLRRRARDARAGALQGPGRAAWLISTAAWSGVILAAGKGARMYPFSERSPKPILPILNRPLLAHQIEVMRDCGITDIHIVVGHLGYQVASTFGDGSQLRRADPLRRAGEHARPRARGRRARIARAAALPADARRHLLPPEGAAAAAHATRCWPARSTPTS